jgi:hypothetical protein
MTSFQLQNAEAFSNTDKTIVERLNVMNSKSTVFIALTGLLFDSLCFPVFVSWNRSNFVVCSAQRRARLNPEKSI